MGAYIAFIKSLTGSKRSSAWAQAKLVELAELFKDPTLRAKRRETLNTTAFYVPQWELRAMLLAMFGKTCHQIGYDSNPEDILWDHNQLFNELPFQAVQKIVLCCGGRITSQY